MEDIAPVLAADINKRFDAAVKSDSVIKQLALKLKKGPLGTGDIRTLSVRLGGHASDALRAVLTPEALPDGRVYWNIAERTIKPVLTQIYQVENALMYNSLSAADKAAGINIAIKQGVDPADRIKEVMDFATNSRTADEISNALNDPVKTTAIDFTDDFIKENAELRDKLGFKQVITREYDGVGLAGGKVQCNWCVGRAGTYYSYKEAYDAGAFERHTGCGCTIDWTTSDEVENEDFSTSTAVPF